MSFNKDLFCARTLNGNVTRSTIPASADSSESWWGGETVDRKRHVHVTHSRCTLTSIDSQFGWG
ncbi:hypothetical protein OUZ56_014747 [Daphnia magna]|uniref:Uncharacterized protein n=1 Tax=Daphnia magna TaxID=35525 RepID=A0ABR0AKQ1_9CRUS|nr:hypothetical protein OUZ56_014747 [Daphnia magna]